MKASKFLAGDEKCCHDKDGKTEKLNGFSSWRCSRLD